jgi:methylglutaconyl-CoA hydratase
MSRYSQITVKVEDSVANVTINRPQARNALNAQAIQELTNAFTSLGSDTSVKAVLLRAAGNEAFCAGADLRELKSNSSPDSRRVFFESIANLVRSIESCPVPVVAAVCGFALAGGLGLIAASDIVIAADNAIFGLPEVGVGLAPLVVSAPLTYSMNQRGLAYLALTGEQISAEDALRFGLVTKVVKLDQIIDQAQKTCQAIAKKGPSAVRQTKIALRDARLSEELDFIYQMADRSALVSLSDEANEGMSAFSEKRAPKW